MLLVPTRWVAWLACAALTSVAVACGRAASAPSEATSITQPTPDRTMDAVVRGFGSPVTLGITGVVASPPPGMAARPPAGDVVHQAGTPRAAMAPSAAAPGVVAAAPVVAATAVPPGNARATTAPVATPRPGAAASQGGGGATATPQPAAPAAPRVAAPSNAGSDRAATSNTSTGNTQPTARPAVPALLNPTAVAPSVPFAPNRPAGSTPARP